jgi:hypothetical protein
MPRQARLLLWLLAALVAVALWYAFRPEKLFLNHKVDEPPPGAWLAPKLPSTAAVAQAVSA